MKKNNHKKVIIVSVLAILFFFRFAGISYAKTRSIPIPAFSTNPNEGESYGILPVWLSVNNGNEGIDRIIAPSLTYNSIFGVTGTFRYFEFLENNKKFEFILGRSTEEDQTIKVKYFDPNIYKDRFILDTEFKYFNDISYRFYGLGPDSKEEDETNYTHNEFKWYVRLAYRIYKNTHLSFQEKFKKVRVRPGSIESLPYTKDVFPTVPGINKATTWSHKMSLIYDNRDVPDQPTEGTYADLSVEFAEDVLATDTSFLKYGVHIKQLLPSRNKKFILVLRALFEKQDGRDLPFYEMSALGGDDTLRGFGRQRFIDNNRVIFTAEQRIILFKLKIFDVTSEWEMAPFVETGRVFDSYNLPFFREFKLVFGVGMRAIVRPNVVGRVDIGLGPEGVKVFVGLGYPF